MAYKPGQYFAAQATSEAYRQRPYQPFKLRVESILRMASEGQDSELCVRPRRESDGADAPARVPLSSADILNKDQINRVSYYRAGHVKGRLDNLRETFAHLRRALVELEEEGVCQRERRSDQKPLRELPEDERRALKAGDIQIRRWKTIRQPAEHIVRRQYEDEVTLAQSARVAKSDYSNSAFTRGDARRIMYTAKGLGVDSDEFFQITPETAPEQVAFILQCLNSERDTLLTKKAEYVANVSIHAQPVLPAESFASASPSEDGEAKANPRKEDAPSEQPEQEAILQHKLAPGPLQTTEWENRARPTQSEPAATATAPDPLRAGLVARKFLFDDIEPIRAELDGTPLDWFWVSLDNRKANGRTCGFGVVKKWATATRENYRANMAELEQQRAQNERLARERRESSLQLARDILSRQTSSPDDRQQAEEILRELAS